MTPSLPTLSIASAISRPMAGSLAEMLATCSIASLVSTGLAALWISPTTAGTALSAPGLLPAEGGIVGGNAGALLDRLLGLPRLGRLVDLADDSGDRLVDAALHLH